MMREPEGMEQILLLKRQTMNGVVNNANLRRRAAFRIDPFVVDESFAGEILEA